MHRVTENVSEPHVTGVGDSALVCLRCLAELAYAVAILSTAAAAAARAVCAG